MQPSYSQIYSGDGSTIPNDSSSTKSLSSIQLRTPFACLSTFVPAISPNNTNTGLSTKQYPNSENSNCPPTNNSIPPANYSIPSIDNSIPSIDNSIPSTIYLSPSTDYSIPSTNYSIPPANYSIPPTNYSIPPANYSIPSTDYSIPSTDYSIPSTNYSIPSTNHLIPSANHLIPSANYSKASQTKVKYALSNTVPTNAPVLMSQSEKSLTSKTNVSRDDAHENFRAGADVHEDGLSGLPKTSVIKSIGKNQTQTMILNTPASSSPSILSQTLIDKGPISQVLQSIRPPMQTTHYTRPEIKTMHFTERSLQTAYSVETSLRRTHFSEPLLQVDHLTGITLPEIHTKEPKLQATHLNKTHLQGNSWQKAPLQPMNSTEPSLYEMNSKEYSIQEKEESSDPLIQAMRSIEAIMPIMESTDEVLLQPESQVTTLSEIPNISASERTSVDLLKPIFTSYPMVSDSLENFPGPPVSSPSSFMTSLQSGDLIPHRLSNTGEGLEKQSSTPGHITTLNPEANFPPPPRGSAAGHFNLMRPDLNPGNRYSFAQGPHERLSSYPTANLSRSAANISSTSSNNLPCATGTTPPAVMPNFRKEEVPTGLTNLKQKTVNLDDLPNPVQVIEDDQKAHGEIFHTLQRGALPPLVTTPVVYEDTGNASPRFIRSSMYCIPETEEMMSEVAIPFALCITPFADLGEKESPIPFVDNGELGPIRCRRCLAYMCPFMRFIEYGKSYKCVFCKAINEVPVEYFNHVDQMGERVDKMNRPELHRGIYEIKATKMYCSNETFPKPPALIFILDVSYHNMKNGVVEIFCANVRRLLSSLPIGQLGSCIKIGFITYDDTIHYYTLDNSVGRPKMMVVSDTTDVFLPTAEGFLCDYIESFSIMDCLLREIPSMFRNTSQTDTILGPAIEAGLEALKSENRPGKLIVLHSSLPSANAPGKLKNREERHLLGTDKEKIALAPQTQFYSHLAQKCVDAGCSVDLLLFNNGFVDLATICQLPRYTGGHLYKYTYFDNKSNGECFLHDLKCRLSNLCAFDVMAKLRTSFGIRPVDFFGHFNISGSSNIHAGSLDKHKSICIEIKYDDKLTGEDCAYVQFAILYTTLQGERRLRIMTLALNIAINLCDVFKSCDINTVVNFMAKDAVSRVLEVSPKIIRETLIHRYSLILSTYRKKLSASSATAQLILPECLKLLPVYLNSVLKSDALSGGPELTVDERVFLMFTVQNMDIYSSMSYFYPIILPLTDLQDKGSPTHRIRCSWEKLEDEGVYLLEDGVVMFIWIGPKVSDDFIQKVFGVKSQSQINTSMGILPELDNETSRKIRQLLNNIVEGRPRRMKMTVVRKMDRSSVMFRKYLCEDGISATKMSYIDFICMLHRKIRALLG